MIDLQRYAGRLAAGESLWWARAVRHAATLLAPFDQAFQSLEHETDAYVTVQTSALLVYGLARSRDQEPSVVVADALAAWAKARSVPEPPEYEATMSPDEWDAAHARWLRLRRLVVDRQMGDLSALLHAAGNHIPPASVRSLDRFSRCPVTALWQDLVDKEPDDIALYGYYGGSTGPLLALGLAGIRTIFNPATSRRRFRDAR